MTTDPTPSSSSSRPDDAPRFRYNAQLADQIEMKWQAFWESHRTFIQPNPGEAGFDPHKPKFYCLDMFPYPSGAGLHVGHPEGYTATDIISRFKRMKGFNVLHPMGWDAFGLPAEQYAIQTGVHPAITTRKAINEFRRQLKRFGFSYDWSREVGTIDEDYYKWTQSIFLKLYDSWFDPQGESPAYPDGKSRRGCARPIADLIAQLESGDLRIGLDGDLVHIGAAANNPLATVGGGGEAIGTRRWHELAREEQRAVIDNQRMAYLDEMTVNWCPALGTVLANDEVIDGKSERGGHPVLRKPLKQWQFRITSYAQRLLDDLALLDWPESTKTMQSEWIGRSEGAEIEFQISDFKFEDGTDTLTVFTTRPDTIFGATYMVVAPEHDLVAAAINMNVGDTQALKAYVAATRSKSEVDRMADAKEKTGVFTGLSCINPATNQKIPIWTADYVLTGYGTGAIMAVPAHDERDFAFAKKFALPVDHVVAPAHGFPDAALEWIFTQEQWGRLAFWIPNSVKGECADRVNMLTAGSVGEAPSLPIQSSFDSGLALIVDETAGLNVNPPWPNGVVRFLVQGCFSGDGIALNSANPEVSLNGFTTAEAKKTIIAWLEKTGRGVKRINFRLRDWVFSRQRYWGEPIPIVFDERGDHFPLSPSALPLKLPELADYSPVESNEPQPLLAKATLWMHTTAREAGISPDVLAPETRVTREANTMPGSAGSSWYFLRYCDPKNSERFISESADDYWMGSGVGGIDLYIGGSEHAVGHLLYSRFWQKALFDLGEVSTPEPFQKLFHQGMITSFAYQRPDKSLVPCDQVDEPTEGAFIERSTGAKLTQIVAKMSKSLKNVVNPDDIIAEFGADTFRLYEMYMGPLEASKPWNTKDTIGCFRFLQRAWRVAIDENSGELKLAAAANPAVEKQLHRTIAKVDQDVPRLAFNTAIASMIEFVNTATANGGVTREQLSLFARTLAPFAPHMAEEMWSKLGHTASIAAEPFPVPDAKLLVDDEVEIPFSMNGKLKHKIVVPKAADAKTVEKLVMADAKVIELLQGKQIMKVIVVPGKMVNVVVGG